MSTTGSLVKFDPRCNKFFIRKVENDAQTEKEKLVQAFYDAVSEIYKTMPKVFIGATDFSQGWESSCARRAIRQVAYRHRDLLVDANNHEINAIAASFLIEVEFTLSEMFKERGEFIPAACQAVSTKILATLSNTGLMSA